MSALEKAKDDFTNLGWACLRNCISRRLIDEARSVMEDFLGKLLGNKAGLSDGFKSACAAYRQFDVQVHLHDRLQATRIKERILLEKDLLELLIHLIGPDLAYNSRGSVVATMAHVSDPLYSKKLHQEMWAGPLLGEVRLWIPLSMPARDSGMECIPGSHTWGLIPNRRRQPVELPEKYEVVLPEVGEGDAILFHTLLVHRSAKNPGPAPRIALATGVRNVYHHHRTNHEHLTPWNLFHFSPMAKIEKNLGNAYLTPFRTLGGAMSHVKDDGKKNIPDYIL
ncbi:MAG: phytanoyl-CoA dioxygenase family protein [Elusimicrobia bacterium]|nr:phytanoyl-CoA dioxygenase family protein [Elusimicrobiota bacterium]